MSFLISDALAAVPAGATGHDNPYSSFILLIGFVLIFYFLLLRPQSKRAKEHRELVSGLVKGDEVLTSGGLAGEITKVMDDFVLLTIANGIEVKLQKSAVIASLPKGTLKATQ